MEVMVFFGLCFFSLFLAYLYFSKQVIYFGVFSAMILLFLGVILSATGNIERYYQFSNVANKTIVGNTTEYIYNYESHVEELTLSRDFINAMGIIMMVIGGFMIADIAVNVNDSRKRVRRVSNA